MIPINSGRTRAAQSITIRFPMEPERRKGDFLRQVLLARAPQPTVDVAHAHDCLRKLHTLPRREIGILGLHSRQKVRRDVAYGSIPPASTGYRLWTAGTIDNFVGALRRDSLRTVSAAFKLRRAQGPFAKGLSLPQRFRGYRLGRIQLFDRVRDLIFETRCADPRTATRLVPLANTPVAAANSVGRGRAARRFHRRPRCDKRRRPLLAEARL